jgi:3D (Asp-Asp-Asp) domain-containing protein
MVAKEYAARMGVLTPLTAVEAEGLDASGSTGVGLTPLDGLDATGEAATIAREEATILATDSFGPRSVVTEDGVGGTVEVIADEPVEVDPASYETNLSVRWFNGRPVRPVRTLTMLVTAYTPSENCCPGTADDLTASMHHVRTNAHRLVAADTRILPLGSMISVPGYDDDQIVPVLDRGGKIKGHRLDVLFPSMREARAWGVRRLKVTVWGFADGRGRDNYRTMRDGR